jgi:hypothetical protein
MLTFPFFFLQKIERHGLPCAVPQLHRKNRDALFL